MKEGVGRVTMGFPSYVDDLHYGLYDGRSTGSAEVRHERMQDLVGRVQRLVGGVAGEHRLPLATDKEESIVLKGRFGRKQRRRGVVIEQVKWLGVILDDCLDFGKHWRHRIGMPCSLLGMLGQLAIRDGV